LIKPAVAINTGNEQLQVMH